MIRFLELCPKLNPLNKRPICRNASTDTLSQRRSTNDRREYKRSQKCFLFVSTRQPAPFPTSKYANACGRFAVSFICQSATLAPFLSNKPYRVDLERALEFVDLMCASVGTVAQRHNLVKSSLLKFTYILASENMGFVLHFGFCRV